LSALANGGAFGFKFPVELDREQGWLWTLTPPRASPGQRAADQGAAREGIGRLLWRVGSPLSPRRARRRGGQLSARSRI